MSDAVRPKVKSAVDDMFELVDATTTDEKTFAAGLMKVFRAMGWRFGANAHTEEGVEGGTKIDWVLNRSGKLPKVFIELKAPKVQLGEKEISQLAGYVACANHVKLAVLTNGAQWRFYQPGLKPDLAFSQQLVAEFDLRQLGADTASRVLVDCLSETAVSTGSALQAVRDWDVEFRQRDEVLTRLQVTCRQALYAPQPSLLNALEAVVRQKMDRAGFTDWTKTELRECLKIVAGKPATPSAEEGVASVQSPPPPYTVPKQLRLGQSRFTVSNWSDVIVKTAKWIADMSEGAIPAMANPTITSEKGTGRGWRLVPGTQYYVNTTANASGAVSKAQAMLNSYDRSDTPLSVTWVQKTVGKRRRSG